MIRFSLLVIMICVTAASIGQDANRLFGSEAALDVQITGSIKSIKKNTNDSTFIVGKFLYKRDDNRWDTIVTEAKTRGNFRLKNCYFPPIKLRFEKKNVKSTVFEGNKALKLVVPCKNTSERNELIRKEYLCYKFYDVLGKYSFRTRLANIQLTETTQKKSKAYDLLGFFVEDNSSVAKRGNGKVVEMKSVNPAAFDEANSIRNDFFQFMIGNADWSSVYQHNSNVLFVDGKYVPVPYDFDMSGFVDASYAHLSPPSLGTGNPRDRVYRGYCKSPAAMEEIRKEFLAKESRIHEIIDAETKNFAPAELKDMHDYIDSFFQMLKSDSDFKHGIIANCR